MNLTHLISDQLPNDQLLTRQPQILSQFVVDSIRTITLIGQLESDSGWFENTDEENISWASIPMLDRCTLTIGFVSSRISRRQRGKADQDLDCNLLRTLKIVANSEKVV